MRNRTKRLTDRRLIQIQALSGTIFLVFVLVHLANTSAATLGVDNYNGFQARARSFYQHPAVELPLLAIPLLVHAAAAIERLRRNGFRRKNASLRSRLHRYSGYFLLTVIWGHVLATRGPSLFQGFHPGFEGLSFSLWWLPGLFCPYYVLLALGGLYHGLNGLTIAAFVFKRPVPAILRHGPGFWLPVAAAGTVLVVAILALGGNLFKSRTRPTTLTHACGRNLV